ncbi:MAG: diadenylate cyclase [Syntrophaceae bacterium]|nr:diadenylate cyclase [Syntrophaceae bacterium]
MIESVLAIVKTIRIQDVFDIAIISIMISVGLIWFKDRGSRFVFVGITLLGAVYFLSRFFQLYLTAMVLQGFFAILLFVLIVIFQEDLRSFFERIALLGQIRGKTFDQAVSNESAEIIAQATAELSHKKAGALIVLQGEAPLDRHLAGGQKLEGLLSQPLLESIFDPHSPGHDGAVLIDGNRLMRFGCHLPLSVSAARRYANLGLRHTAALGLSERCDALCIVVSEERGTISLGKGERIMTIANASALRVELEAFFARRMPPPEATPSMGWLKKNIREKVIALILACILWGAFGYQRETVQREFIVPIQYLNVPVEWVMEEPKTADARVVFSGPSQAFQLLSTDSIKLTLDLTQLQPGAQEIPLTPEMVKAPSNLSVERIQPERIKVVTSRLLSQTVRIEVLTENNPPKGLAVQSIEILPAEANILIPPQLKGKRIRVLTEPIDLSLLDVQQVFTPNLRYPSGVQFTGGKTPLVRVVIKIRKLTSTSTTP